jgi:hypothetical protein
VTHQSHNRERVRACFTEPGSERVPKRMQDKISRELQKFAHPLLLLAE